MVNVGISNLTYILVPTKAQRTTAIYNSLGKENNVQIYTVRNGLWQYTIFNHRLLSETYIIARYLFVFMTCVYRAHDVYIAQASPSPSFSIQQPWSSARATNCDPFISNRRPLKVKLCKPKTSLMCQSITSGGALLPHSIY